MRHTRASVIQPPHRRPHQRSSSARGSCPDPRPTRLLRWLDERPRSTRPPSHRHRWWRARQRWHWDAPRRRVPLRRPRVSARRRVPSRRPPGCRRRWRRCVHRSQHPPGPPSPGPCSHSRTTRGPPCPGCLDTDPTMPEAAVHPYPRCAAGRARRCRELPARALLRTRPTGRTPNHIASSDLPRPILLGGRSETRGNGCNKTQVLPWFDRQ